MSSLTSSDRTATRAETPWRGAVIVFVALTIIPIGYLGNEGISPLVALGGLLTLPWAIRPKAPPAGVWILVALTAWAVASYAWSPLEPVQTTHLKGYSAIQALVAPKLVFQLVLYGACVASALALTPRWRDRALLALAVGTVATLALLLVEGLDSARIYTGLSVLVGQHWRPDLAIRNAARGAYAAMVLIWPATLALQQRRGLAGVGVAAMVVGAIGALMLGIDAPTAALVAAAAAFGLVRYLGRAGVRACLAGTVLYFLAAPWPFLTRAASAVPLPQDIAKLSWTARLNIWRFTSTEIVRRPLFGWGLDSSRAWPNQIPMHPHDAALQLWLETGAVGAVLATLFWGWLFLRIAAVERQDRTAAAIMAATAAAYLTIGAISFGVWQEWWLATGAFAIAACVMVFRAGREQAANWGETELVALGG